MSQHNDTEHIDTKHSVTYLLVVLGGMPLSLVSLFFGIVLLTAVKLNVVILKVIMQNVAARLIRLQKRFDFEVKDRFQNFFSFLKFECLTNFQFRPKSPEGFFLRRNSIKNHILFFFS